MYARFIGSSCERVAGTRTSRKTRNASVPPIPAGVIVGPAAAASSEAARAVVFESVGRTTLPAAHSTAARTISLSSPHTSSNTTPIMPTSAPPLTPSEPTSGQACQPSRRSIRHPHAKTTPRSADDPHPRASDARCLTARTQMLPSLAGRPDLATAIGRGVLARNVRPRGGRDTPRSRSAQAQAAQGP